MKTMTAAEFHRALIAQKVPREHAAFVCPMCGTVQSAQDLINAGSATDFDDVTRYLGFSCVGRWTHGKPPPKKKGTQVGCNWTLGGLLELHQLEVVWEDGTASPMFEPATPEQARENMVKNQKAKQ